MSRAGEPPPLQVPLIQPLRIAPRHALAEGVQQVWIGFGGRADRAWLRLLRPGFRHCFAVVEDARGWTVIEPLSGRLLVARPDLVPGFDLPGFYRRAGLTVLGPFQPGPPACGWLPELSPYSCVSLCRALLGEGAPFAVTPHGLYRRLEKYSYDRKKVIDTASLRA
ncbi:hypothetical protein [Teichococcus deserti]|uniref:hypothetical protein n=1 Tax=Teichococcus deserti TaxID=1817963 RepID=UPI0009FB0CA5|nr:hypothetical protein [Pseudoroseomonas deserti]